MIIGENLLIVFFLSFVLRQCYSLCDSKKLTEWTGVIASPGVHTGIYENNMDCKWEIKVTRGSKVKITFELFDLEEGCLDYVKVNDSSGQILYECGAPVVPPVVMSSSEEVQVVFHSDESGAARGFKAVYTGVCELDIDENAVLATPGYPNSPPLGVKCSWNIHGRESQVAIIKPVTTAKMLAGKSDLPDCGNSPLKILTSGPPKSLTELCMKESRQAYTGNITLVYDSSSTSHAAWTGQLEIEFTDNINISCSKLCAHSSGCHPVLKLSKLEFNCDCIDGYDGITCEERKDTCFGNPCLLNSSNCVEERDLVPGSAIHWSTTLVKHVDTKPCPGGAIGEATRNCVHDVDSSSGGFWTRPDLSLCVSQHILQILHDTQTLLQNASKAHTEHLSNITSRLAAATSLELGFNGKWHELFPGDLSTVVDVLDMVSQADNFVDTEVTADVIQEYIATVDNILDPKTTDTWRNALAGLVEAKVSKVIESMQMFISKFLPITQGWSDQGLAIEGGGQVVDGSMTRTIFEKVVRNLGLHVITGNLKDGLYGGFKNIAATSSVVFPGLILNSSDPTMADVPLIIYVARFSSVSPLLSMRESRYHKDLQNDSNLINSDVLSVEVLNMSKMYFQHLREPVVLTFSLRDPSLRRHHADKCVFMNMSASSHKDRWSTSGCKVAEDNNTHVICHCHHLTNFAVLMDVYDNQGNIDATNKLMLAYISYIGGSLSILGCVITIIVFRYFKLESDRIRIHQQLGLSVIFVQILFICVGKTGKEFGTPMIGCRILATLLHYCLTALFCWMLVEGTHLYIVLVRVFKRGFHFKKYLLVGWGIPLLVVGISLGAFHDKYGVGNVCWLSQELLLVSFVPTVGLVVTVNTVILALVIRLMIKSNNSAYKFQTQERSNLRLGVKASVVLLPLLGLTWSLGFLAVNTGQAEVMSYVFTYLFTITNSFQGVLFFIFHCLLNVDVRQAFERRYNRKKRSSYVDTTSSRLRKMSEPEVSDCNVQRVYCKDMNPVFSILDNLSPAGLRAALASPVSGPAVNMKPQGGN